MKLLWFSANSIDDMCFTSQRYMAEGLQDSATDVYFINHDDETKHRAESWQHISIKASKTPGFKSSSLAKNMSAWLRKQSFDSNCVAIVDWRLIAKISSVLKQYGIPWILLDRSPPADRGFLAKLQWPIWRNAWKLVAKSEVAIGSVVSFSHQQYVKNKISIDDSKLFQLPAGVDLEKFTNGKKDENLILIYHGRLDKHRGVLALPMLIKKAESQNLKINLKLIGQGNCYQQLSNIAATEKAIEVYPQMSQTELSKHLKTATIGLLPMPNYKIWTISSPLKRSEYIASGLLIYGIEHNGHKFADKEVSWMKLAPQHDFHDEAINWIKQLNNESIADLSAKSRQYAEENLGWSHTILRLKQAIQSVKRS